MMQGKVTFEYAIIRYVPKVEREEFFNIGAIVFSKEKKYLDLKYNINKDRFSAYGCEEDIMTIRKYMSGWQAICKGSSDSGLIGSQDLPYRFRWLTANRSTIIQCSKVHPGLTLDPHKTLEDLFTRYVL